ncbi:hypothetical protein [Leptolyngbya ohadii]|uniref:hypothetical protein n=1 Tax=Leptolyngbya ohadii TaxID=1962290 RepID=UPI000B5A11DF|nr:hypothetical protein [Leptolyngbya ohadii]
MKFLNRLSFRILFAALSSLLLFPTASIADANQARSYLEEAIYNELPDYSPAIRPYTGSIANGQTASRLVRLRSGTEYAFMAACDDYCSDIDLFLYDRAGVLVDSDEEEDDYPLITYVPGSSGNYRLVVRMYSCSNSSCGYAVSTMSR